MQRRSFKSSRIREGTHGNDILETSRKAALESAANLLETISYARKLKRNTQGATTEHLRFDDDEPATPRDFLFDMLRLNASYLNEIAKLGSRHKDLVQRTLENLYATNMPGSPEPPGSNILSFDEEHSMREFAVHNDIASSEGVVILEWDKILSNEPDPFVFYCDEQKYIAPKADNTGNQTRFQNKEVPERVELPIAFGVPKLVKLVIDPSRLLARRYQTTLRIQLPLDGQRMRVRRIPILIDMRPKKSGAAATSPAS